MRNFWIGYGLVCAVVAIAALYPEASWAAGSDAWVKPAAGIIDDIKAGLVTIGAPVVGLGVIGLGIFAAATGRIEWNRAVMIIIGGVLIMAGPAGVTKLLEAAKSAS